MTLWSMQPRERVEDLRRDGFLRTDPRHAYADFLPAYRWMADQMARRIGPPPGGVEIPLWAWFAYRGTRRPKPDLRSRGFFQPGTEAVRIEIEVAPGGVLLSWFDDWHCVLNLHYHSLSANEFDEIEAEMVADGVENIIHFEDYPENWRQRIVASWDRIFDLDTMPDFNKSEGGRPVQACLWEIRADDVRSVKEFVAR